MKRLRFGCREIFFIVLIALTIAARLVDAWPASSRDIAGVRALAASNGAARSFVAASLSEDDSPSRKAVRRWRARVAAIEATEATEARARSNAAGVTARGAARGTEIGAEHR